MDFRPLVKVLHFLPALILSFDVGRFYDEKLPDSRQSLLPMYMVMWRELFRYCYEDDYKPEDFEFKLEELRLHAGIFKRWKEGK